jgi:hypothetical protein
MQMMSVSIKEERRPPPPHPVRVKPAGVAENPSSRQQQPQRPKAVENRPNTASCPAQLEERCGGDLISTVLGGPYRLP